MSIIIICNVLIFMWGFFFSYRILVLIAFSYPSLKSNQISIFAHWLCISCCTCCLKSDLAFFRQELNIFQNLIVISYIIFWTFRKFWSNWLVVHEFTWILEIISFKLRSLVLSWIIWSYSLCWNMSVMLYLAL